MRRIFMVALLVMTIGFSLTAEAQLKKPRVTAQEGQSKEQQAKDTEECHMLAIKQTGVNPDALEMRMTYLRSKYSQDTMQRGNSLVLSPGQGAKGQKSLDESKEIKEENEKYIKAFSEAMEARGYKVK